jgi:serine/threonine-protein kinase
MGVVVAATDTQLERRVAIKFLLPEYAQHPEASKRFLREARSAVKIHSEHVARVIDVGTMEGGAPYMVMEYLEGKDLAAVLEERMRLPVEEAVGYLLEACEAIAEAHSVGIVHRDLKPANVFVASRPDGSSIVKVLDFGISKAMMTTSSIDHSLTRTSSLMGSPLYMSPEQMRSAKNVDPRTDIWALGVILYELLSGKPPFDAESIPELSAKVLLEEPLTLRSTRNDVPEILEGVVKRTLAKTPDGRYPTVADLAVALAPFGPARSRNNVERAVRVLQASRGSPVSTKDIPPSFVASPAYARTAATWAESSEQRAASTATATRSRVALAGALVTGGAIVAGLVFVFGGRAKAPLSTAPPAVTALAVAVQPVTAPVPAPAAVAPPATASVTPAPVAASAAANTPAPSVAPSAAANTPAPSAAPLAPLAHGPTASHARPRKPASNPAAHLADPFDGFGSRK